MREKTNHMRPRQKEEGGGRDEEEENKKKGEKEVMEKISNQRKNEGRDSWKKSPTRRGRKNKNKNKNKWKKTR